MHKASKNKKVRYWLIYIIIISCFSLNGFGQSKFNAFFKPSDSLNTQRRNAVIISEAALGTVSLLALDQLWYSDFQRSSFQTTNDNSEWLQMDKLGHVFSAYQMGRVGANALKWSGVSQKDQLIYGATLGFTFLTAVEVLDGFSEEWGFSWGDMASNALGTGLYIGQELLWQEQRFTLKFSFNSSPYATQNPDKLGDGLLEEVLKDYNGQTYWLSGNFNSFFKNDFLPDWFNIAFGYGADGMITGRNNAIEFPNQNRTRQYYLSFDIDFTRIKTKSHVLRTLFDVINVIKVPSPTFEINSEGRAKFHYIYF